MFKFLFLCVGHHPHVIHADTRRAAIAAGRDYLGYPLGWPMPRHNAVRIA